MEDSLIIKINGLVKKFPMGKGEFTALKGIDLTFSQGEFAGLVGGMMFGPEMEVGSLYDHPYHTKGDAKERAMMEARRVVDYLKKAVFPIHGL